MQKPDEIAQMPRRAFLAWGSVFAVGALGGKAFSAHALPVASPAIAPADRITVGYGAPLMADASPVIEASSLSAGDAEFARRGARVTIFGLEGMASTLASEGMKSFSLDIAYPVADSAEPVLVHAWNFVKGPLAHVSPGNSFVAPVGYDSGLNLVLESEDGAGVKRRAECRFTVGSEAGTPKLLRGLYALAPSDAFAWGGLVWRLGEGSRPRLVQRMAPVGESAGSEFPCLAMMVDYSNSGADLRA